MLQVVVLKAEMDCDNSSPFHFLPVLHGISSVEV